MMDNIQKKNYNNALLWYSNYLDYYFCWILVSVCVKMLILVLRLKGAYHLMSGEEVLNYSLELAVFPYWMEGCYPLLAVCSG